MQKVNLTIVLSVNSNPAWKAEEEIQSDCAVRLTSEAYTKVVRAAEREILTQIKLQEKLNAKPKTA